MYNGERFLEETLESCLTQDYQDFEVVVLDDGSTDDVETRQSLNDEHIEWFRAGSALNVLKREKA